MTEPTPLDKARDAATEEQLRKALTAARGSTLVAASILGISDRQVRRLKARYGIIIERTVAAGEVSDCSDGLSGPGGHAA